jgi:hypothetical protein
MDMSVPDGVNKINASTIIPQDKVFTYHGQYAAFSDYFRYRMIQLTGNMWVDADTLCLTDKFFEETENGDCTDFKITMGFGNTPEAYKTYDFNLCPAILNELPQVWDCYKRLRNGH